jgi:hypothetical protein
MKIKYFILIICLFFKSGFSMCDSNCSNCQQGKCVECLEKFVLISDKCEQVKASCEFANCLHCDSVNLKCATCAEGYSLIGNKCVSNLEINF